MQPADRVTPLDEWLLPRVRYRSVAGDVAVAVGLVVLGAASVAAGIAPPPRADLPWGSLPWPSLAMALACVPGLLVKRRVPVAAVAWIGVVLVVDAALVHGTMTLAPMLAFVDALWAAMLSPVRRMRRLTIGVALAACVALTVVAQPSDPFELGRALLVFAALIVAPVVWGISVRQRDELLAAERRRADAVERAAEAERARAVRAERVAMAHELHDELAARLSAIALQSAALAARPARDEREAASLRAVRASSVEALDELRQLIGVLADDRDDAVVAVGIEDLETLRADAERFGVDLAVRGAVPDAVLSSAASHALMRIAREAIGNAARHAPGAPVTLALSLDASGEAVTLEVRNPLPHTTVDAPGNGLGLALMAERWRAVGGSGEAAAVDAGASDAGQWRVRATVPRLRATGGAEATAEHAGEARAPRLRGRVAR